MEHGVVRTFGIVFLVRKARHLVEYMNDIIVCVVEGGLLRHEPYLWLTYLFVVIWFKFFVFWFCIFKFVSIMYCYVCNVFWLLAVQKLTNESPKDRVSVLCCKKGVYGQWSADRRGNRVTSEGHTNKGFVFQETKNLSMMATKTWAATRFWHEIGGGSWLIMWLERCLKYKLVARVCL
jgi:hypothetical protein